MIRPLARVSATADSRAANFRIITLAALASMAFLAACSSDGPTDLRKSDRVTDTAPTSPAPTTPTDTTTTTSSSNPFAGTGFYVNPYSNAQKTADSWRTTRPADATQMDKIATQSQAMWLGEWSGDIYTAANNATTMITAAAKLPIFVAYNITQRDCGGLSGGGGATPDAYRNWISALANGIGARKAIVILEPDALAAMDCLSATDQQTRFDLLKYAVGVLKGKGGISVYLDAGHSRWKSATDIASRLVKADVARANGFSLNISNFLTTASNTTYGESVSALVGGKHFVIDTGRNGLGPTADYQWCNPPGRAIGARPTAMTGSSLVDAYLWIKTPGESDGACNGNPSAGTWMPEYALGLAQRG